MRRDGISKSELARRLGVDEKDVRRLIDPKYQGSKVERLHAALAICGIGAQITLLDSTHRERLLGSGARPGRRTTKPDTAAATRRAG